MGGRDRHRPLTFSASGEWTGPSAASLGSVASDQSPDLPLELREPVVQRRLRLDADLELAVREHAHAARVHGLQRDDDRLAREADPIEDLVDGVDLLDGGGRERHSVYPSAVAVMTVAGG